ncbi:hypothetical protein BWU74_15605 [Paraburkholderia caledonica]|nr:hypothetical protein BWU74_15605 [Burkholderia sp. Bk]
MGPALVSVLLQFERPSDNPFCAGRTTEPDKQRGQRMVSRANPVAALVLAFNPIAASRAQKRLNYSPQRARTTRRPE